MRVVKRIDYDKEKCSTATKLLTEMSRPLNDTKMAQMEKRTDAFLARECLSVGSLLQPFNLPTEAEIL